VALTLSERAGVVRQLLDLGLSPAQVQRRTQIPRLDIAAADAVTKSAVASRAAAEYPALTLFQASTLADYDDDPDAVQALLAAASEGEVRLDHAAQQLRDDREAARRTGPGPR
jgi:ParB family chromosome partitioning protein